MEKNYFAAIELGYIYNIALVISYHNNQFDVVASSIIKSFGYKDGVITDEDAFLKAIENIKNDIYEKYFIKLDEVILVLPNNNHKIYSATFGSNILTEMQIIGKKQIDAIRQKIRMVELRNDELLVDELPTQYVLDQDRILRSEPINYSSSVLNIKSNIHTLPKTIVESIVSSLEKNDLKVIGKFINCSCGVNALINDFELENDTICIQILQDVTTICCYKKSYLIRSLKVDFGVANLIDALKKSLEIDDDEALMLFEKYFVCDVDYASDIIFDTNNHLSEKRISGILLNELSNGISLILKSCEKLENDCQLSSDCVYLLLGWLNDYDYFVDEFSKFCNRNLIEKTLDKIGIDSQMLLNCFGAITLYIQRNKEEILKSLESDDDLDLSSSNINTINKKEIDNTRSISRKFNDFFDD
ncbi:MAG: hypothetical protein MR270_04430 [Erysipelotrichaceae bacterium]|nr:hypothetical protein [Erysipelotrichaceae bacterium]